jgi:hypothetical protein
MPNWCNNSITITGSTQTIKTLWEEAHSAADGEFGLLNAMYPMPQELKDTTAPSADGSMDWYAWRTSEWGTKWDVSDEGLEFEDNGDGTASITGWFDSAWAPPVGAFEEFTGMMDGVYAEIYYHEPGMAFVGYWSSEGGDDYYEYHEGADTIPDYLDEYFGISEDLAMWAEENEEA